MAGRVSRGRDIAEGLQQLGVDAKLGPHGLDPQRGAEGGLGATAQAEVLHQSAQDGMAGGTCSAEQPISSGGRVAETCQLTGPGLRPLCPAPAARLPRLPVRGEGMGGT